MFTLLSFCESSAEIWQLVGKIINIIKIVIPIIIVVLAMLDLGKAVMAGEEKEIKEAQKMLIKRLIYGVVIFFVVTIVQVVFNLIGRSVVEDDAACWACATSPSGQVCKDAVNKAQNQ
ncbi:MAG: hypothetical protein SOX86_02850 [Bacilli bacterium]|nr:hypothetical protein [Mycoplasmatota bacterium]MDY4236929.1 hypothetical protein [Bacilli bacterium]